MIDIRPATQRVARLLAGLDHAVLDRPTPCPGSTVGDLVDHIGTFTLAFTGKARHEGVGRSGPPPKPDAANLEPGWRDRIARDLEALADAWAEPAAWEGMTTAGGIEMPSEVAGLVVLDELVVHGWDVAVSTGLPYEPSDEDMRAVTAFVAAFDAPRDGKLFGPVVPVPGDAPPIDRLLGLTGRDPRWAPPA
jgi:uncharacterized protein (TIGR03086 family)